MSPNPKLTPGGPWIQTQSGKAIYFPDPDPEQITIHDILLGLDRAARYAGQTRTHYSVLTHTIGVAIETMARLQEAGIPEKDWLPYVNWARLHDAHEAYTGDITTPLQKALGTDARKALHDIQERLDRTIYTAMGFDYAEVTEEVRRFVTAVDRAMVWEEHLVFFSEPDAGPWLQPDPDIREQNLSPRTKSWLRQTAIHYCYRENLYERSLTWVSLGALCEAHQMSGEPVAFRKLLDVIAPE